MTAHAVTAHAVTAHAVTAVSFDQACFDSIKKLTMPGGAIRLDRMDVAAPGAMHCGTEDFLSVPEADLERLSREAFASMQFKSRPDFVRDIAGMAAKARGRERLVLETLLDNARLAAAGVFPICQDTGTAGVYAWKGDKIITEGPSDDVHTLERGALAAWREKKLRNSQLIPVTVYDEKNSGDNGPLAGEIFSRKGSDYLFLFLAKGGGSSNKTSLYQETKSVLEPAALKAFLAQAIGRLGVSACPPYTIGLAIGGQTPEQCLMAAKLATTGALDALPTGAQDLSPFGDLATEALMMDLAGDAGWGAQFGGRFMARAARAVRLHRHAASLPIALAVSCAAHRHAFALVNRDGFFLEHLCGADEIEDIITAASSAGTLDGSASADAGASVPRPVNLGTDKLGNLRAGEMVALYGTVVLVRDAAHARLRAMLGRGEALPEWTRLPAYYASPTETPDGAVLGSLGPTTAKRMDVYQEELMSRGAFLATIGKGERGPACRDACKKYGGVYFAAIGGAAATGTARYVKSSRTVDWPELGMEAVREVELCGLPALVAVDGEGSDFYSPEFLR